MQKPIEYEQTDSRWRNIPYTSTGNRSQTIGTSGCGPTCAAMVVATLKDRAVTPVQAAAWSVNNGYRTANDGTAWAYFAAYLKQWNIPVVQTGIVQNAIAALRKDYMVITAAGKGIWTSGGHFILAYGLAQNESKVLIHDPNSEAQYRELANISNYRSECTQFWIVKGEWKMEIKDLAVKDLDRGKNIDVSAVNIDGSNYVKLRDLEKLAPVVIGNEGAVPTIRINYNK